MMDRLREHSIRQHLLVLRDAVLLTGIEHVVVVRESWRCWRHNDQILVDQPARKDIALHVGVISSDVHLDDAFAMMK